MEKKLDQIEDLCPSILIYLEHSNFGTDFKMKINWSTLISTHIYSKIVGPSKTFNFNNTFGF